MKFYNIPILKTVNTPSNPPAGFLKIYFKSDGKLYSLNSAGVETDISNGWWGWAVDSVNGQTWIVTLTAADVWAYADSNPSWFISNISWEDLSTADNTTSQFISQWDNVSALTNDAGYVDSTQAAAAAPIQSVSGTAVDNTDPANPVINTPAIDIESYLKFGWDGSDGVVDGTANITITGSNDTYIVKNYSSWAAGSAARVLTITPTNCILHIRVRGNCDLSNWTFNFAGKWASGWAQSLIWAGNAGSNGFALWTSLNTWWGGGDANDPYARWGWGWAWSAANGSWTSDGSGGSTAGGTKNSDIPLTYIKWARRIYICTWWGGWSWGADGSWCIGGAWGAWGGAVILEVLGNLTLNNSTTVIDMSWADGSVWTDPGGSSRKASSWWGWGGWSFYCMYNGTLTGTCTPDVTAGSWWPSWPNGVEAWATGWVWLSLIEKNTVFT